MLDTSCSRASKSLVGLGLVICRGRYPKEHTCPARSPLETAVVSMTGMSNAISRSTVTLAVSPYFCDCSLIQ